MPGRPPIPGPRVVRSRRRPPPEAWRAEIAEMLISERELASRVGEMAELIQNDFAGRELVLVALLRGAVMFAADLARRLSLPLRLDFLSVSSYRNGLAPGELRISDPSGLDLKGRDVLLVDDIADSGRTLGRALDELRARKPRSLKTCVLLEKTARATRAAAPDYTGFRIPDAFVVGYGLDFAERYRNIPFIGLLHPRLYESQGCVKPAPSRNEPAQGPNSTPATPPGATKTTTPRNDHARGPNSTPATPPAATKTTLPLNEHAGGLKLTPATPAGATTTTPFRNEPAQGLKARNMIAWGETPGTPRPENVSPVRAPQQPPARRRAE
jgi:hypoxanthine phosphoribosyltransferase